MAETQIRQWQTLQDGLDKVYQSTAPLPTPGKDEVLVEIRAVSLNYRDTEVAMGLYKHHKTVSEGKTKPLVPCADACGVITAVGEGSATIPWKVGDRVVSIFNQTHLKGQVKAHHMAHGLGLPLDGVLATHRVFPSYGLVKAPEYMTDEEASCLPIAAVTAWMAINAIVTSSSDDKLKKAQNLGADFLINYRSNPEWQDEVMKLTGDEGADIVFECGGARTLRKSFDAVAFGGLINSIGYLSGKEDETGDRTNVNVLALRRNVTLKGILNGPRERFEEMCDFYRQHEIHPVIDRVFEFDLANEALGYLFSGGHFGKVVVKVRA
ncbi:putative zinc-binding dehydrogenase [Neofusicoccum parvum]|uniref:Zinc-binding dehydrogenase n=1 Tax=Neofusicoccum parvum TaxID=310453 RepID=A0ACB5SKW0_9PEZI|nr:putative zinc-binding dehydrogenase [Neofusicoccum parvum]